MTFGKASLKNRALLLLWLLEVLLLMAAVIGAAWLRFMNDPEGHEIFSENLTLRAALVAMFVTTAMSALGLYQVHVRLNRFEFALRLLVSFAIGGIGLMVLYYLIPTAYIGRGVIVIAMVLGLLGMALLRFCVMHVFSGDLFRRRVLVLGAGHNADLINTRMRRGSDRRAFTLVGFVPINGQESCVPTSMQVVAPDGLSEVAHRLQISEVVVAPDERRGGLPMEEMLTCVQRGVAMTDLSTFFEREAGIVTTNLCDPSWLVFSGGFDHSTSRCMNKRLFDVLAASALLLVAWPFMVVVALLVRLESRGPILYQQTRIGEGGRPFELIKFRSMRVDAEGDGVARWAQRGDDRTTRVGKFIRLTRLDELPQLFNILRGEMSIVGPRPERPQFVDMLSREIRYYAVRHCVKPGLTGWAQLRYPYGASVRDAEEKLKFDLFYVKNHGLVFDLIILLQTVEVVLFQRGSR
ncbi:MULTISPECIES: TIGR03013 family XrtA/PEP-CTERM system glycosyltransferase [unclassified Lysobacter]|uniref:TIGR03013 family XrtA/PEP-CTERM system glycosyltransferase n=1 Tax=unclassified Lysobacter TaxID=2635362 RepID=UPI001C2176CE|nr:TIGR03013 family XrtA/PEP-CTERM system glycosyltransferase [Lysobacter sp. MMG2]MBU8974944.1 TIGR03013 family PEP-CTERM/XrtA system glycosyltransferase [Lysobacter sp. MMG2]